MNKLIITDDIIETINVDDCIVVEYNDKNEIFSVVRIKIIVKKSSELEIDYIGKNDHKLDVVFVVEEGVNFNLFEKRVGAHAKVQEKYILCANSYVVVNKFYNTEGIKEMDCINLDGEGAFIDFNFKTISSLKEKYDQVITHRAIKTTSKINNAGVNLENGSLIFNVTSVVPNGIKNCIVDQGGRIVTLNDKECLINPNLLIEENEVEANHAAAIGRFSDDELFYLMSRGITHDNAVNLLIKGFLLGSEQISETRVEEIKDIIDSYWR